MKKEEQFFIRHLRAVLFYRIFKEKLLRRFPDTFVYVQKTQITFAIRHLFACVSFLRVRKKGELPAPYLTVIFGMPYRLYIDRDKVVSEPYPGRWTTHFVISSPDHLDDVFSAADRALRICNGEIRIFLIDNRIGCDYSIDMCQDTYLY